MNFIGQSVALFIGIFLGNIFLDMTLRKEDNNLLKITKDILIECQKNLARNEFCELKAVPKQKNMENTN